MSNESMKKILEQFVDMQIVRGEYRQFMLERYRESIKRYKTIFLYGGGYSGFVAVDFIYNELSGKEVYFIDDDPTKQGKELYRGIYCYGMEKMFGCDSESSIILITSSWYANEIFEKVYRKPGVRKSKYRVTGKLGKVMVDKYFINLLIPAFGGSNFDLQNSQLQKEKLINVFDLLEDDISAEIFLQRLFYICGVIPAMAGFASYPQYFPQEIKSRFVKDEVFLDCGAYIGDTIEEFRRQTNDVFKKIYAFEMNSDIYKKLQESPVVKDNRIVTMNKGVSDKTGTVRYRSDDGDSSYAMWDVNLFEANYAEIVSIDDMVEKGALTEKVTFVKMDIEGAEMDALKGMKNLLKRDKPKLAVCIYHKTSDLTLIPEFIKETVPEYKFIIRHHSGSMSETVLYAFI
ncbi:MAG: FkbM family methyltransferase [Selenomonadaceae bacterium]|nr:FkbM family methyltransferase [Selenomonadaceae bacterium]